jgi:hypothetical protein
MDEGGQSALRVLPHGLNSCLGNCSRSILLHRAGENGDVRSPCDIEDQVYLLARAKLRMNGR